MGVATPTDFPFPRQSTSASSATQGTAQLVELRHAYGFDQTKGDGSGEQIGVVAAFTDTTLGADLDRFDSSVGVRSAFGVPGQTACSLMHGPHPCFSQFSVGSAAIPAQWAMETSLDVEWAHAMAPGADIVVEESRSDSVNDLLAAVDRVVRRNVSVVVMSWGVRESATELGLDAHFRVRGVTFVAAAGDSGPGILQYPSASPWVLSVGGTELVLDVNGNRLRPESAWPGTTGGLSTFEPQPAFQNSFYPGRSGRSVPDVAYAASVNGGYAVYSSSSLLPGWFHMEADSAGAPQWAAIIAIANQIQGRRLFQESLDLAAVYSAARVEPSAFTRISTGSNDHCGSLCDSSRQFDSVTGLGSPNLPLITQSL